MGPGRSGSYEVTARSAGGAQHRQPERPTNRPQDTKSVVPRVRPPEPTAQQSSQSYQGDQMVTASVLAEAYPADGVVGALLEHQVRA